MNNLVAQLKKPNVFQILYGSIFSNSISKKNIKTPEQVGGYKLVSEIKKKNKTLKRFAVGIYTNGSEKFFIKTWVGKTKDLDYMFLANECRTNIVLNNKIKEIGLDNEFQVPEIKNVITTKDTLSVVFEYISGPLLDDSSVDIQAKNIIKCQEILTRISSKLTHEEKKEFIKRSFYFYLVTIPFMCLFLMVLKPRKILTIAKSFIKSVSSVTDIWDKDLVLAHRDLKPYNIIMSEDRIYLVDSEKMALTLPQYDPVYIAVEPDIIELNNVIQKNNLLVYNNFLKTYVSVHFALNFRNMPFEQAYYLSLLN